MSIFVKRYPNNPILGPDRTHSWEAQAVFNGCPVRDEDGYHLLYRAQSYPQKFKMEMMAVSSIGHVFSVDGYSFTGERTQLIVPEKDWEQYGCEDPRVMVEDIKNKNAEMGLCRMVAGYAWPWLSNPSRNEKPTEYDIDINGCKLKWNSTDIDWVNSPNAINEVGCIHTTQGYDLNYVGVVVGPELKYDSASKKMYVDRNNYYDRNGQVGVTDDEELKRYIINIYKTLFTRGIKGAFVYVVDNSLRKYFEEFLKDNLVKESEVEKKLEKSLIVDKIFETFTVPILGSAPCGAPFYSEENREDEMQVDKTKKKPGFEYFILRASGDSMNLAGIEDGDLVLCRRQLKAETGDRVIALLGDDVTIKIYDKKDGRRILLPKSSNPIHQPIIPGENGATLGVVQEVLHNEKW